MSAGEKGRRYEWKIRKKLRELGADFVIRSSASLSPFDLMGLFKEKRKIVLVQCKTGDSYTDSFKKKLEEELKQFDGMYEVECRVV